MRACSVLAALVLAVALVGCKKEEPSKGGKTAAKTAVQPQPTAQTEAKTPLEEAPKAKEAPKAEEVPKAEEPAKTEEAPKGEEGAKTEEAPKAQEAPKAEETPKAQEALKGEQKPQPASEEKAQLTLEERRNKIQEIYRLGRSNDPEDIKKLKEIITSDAAQSFEKATAIRALGNVRRDELVEPLKELTKSSDLAVKSEAVILLYQWGEKEITLPIMEQLLDQGVALRRAFFKGIQDGKYVYDEGAESFFTKAMKAKQVHVKLDGALGLLHLGKTDVAISAFKEALSDMEKEYVRLTAVSYLASARDIPEAKELLELAAKDPSPKVANRAKQILGTMKPTPPPAAASTPEAAPAPAEEKKAE